MEPDRYDKLPDWTLIQDFADKDWLRSPDVGWLLFAGACGAGALLWVLVFLVWWLVWWCGR